MQLQDVGNITYGYLGRAAGLNPLELLIGGHVAALMKDRILDSPDDSANILLGIILWELKAF